MSYNISQLLNLLLCFWDDLWKIIHKFRGLERVETHITNSAACVACGAVVEDLDHLLRHCEVKVFWTSIVRHDCLVEFLSLPYPGWVHINLQDRLYFSNSDPDWDILFGDILWNLWLFHNMRTIDLDNELSDIVMGYSRELRDATRRALDKQGQQQLTTVGQRPNLTVWSPPNTGSLKVNVDEA
ncbi:hypothetical protein GQ457_01G023090 [Hibiscus cannabinus]